jgi:hypothetical protein
MNTISTGYQTLINEALAQHIGNAEKPMTAGQKWCDCPEPDSNRHGVASEGFSYPLQLSLLPMPKHPHLESGLYLHHVASISPRCRQGPSSLYTFPK